MATSFSIALLFLCNILLIDSQSSCANTCTDVICDGVPCSVVNDGLCDDGGPGSEYGVCDPGTDCADCGSRSTACANTCLGANGADSDIADGFCDDGGGGASFSYCSYGTDCSDCGARSLSTSSHSHYPHSHYPSASHTHSPHSHSPHSHSPSLNNCDNSCQAVSQLGGTTVGNVISDGDCDDGGVGAEYNVCALGTDCADCGGRPGGDSISTGVIIAAAGAGAAILVGFLIFTQIQQKRRARTASQAGSTVGNVPMATAQAVPVATAQATGSATV